MVRKLGRVAAGLAAAVGMAVLAGGVLAGDDKEKTYPIEEIMKKGHGSKGLLKGIETHVKESKWDEAKTDAKLLKAFGVSLGKNEPPMGEAKSWKKLAEAYKENTDSVYKAVEKKDAKGVTEGLGKIRKSCMGCHKEHKPK
jgi:cytochrome c556